VEVEKPEGLRVYKDTDELARAAASLFLNLSSEKIKEKGVVYRRPLGRQDPGDALQASRLSGFQREDRMDEGPHLLG